MDSEKTINILKYTKNLFKDTRNEIASAEDAFYAIKSEEACRSVKEKLENKYAENIALLIFLDAYSNGYSFVPDDLQPEELITQYTEEYQKEEFMLGIETKNMVDTQNFLSEIVDKYYVSSTPEEIESARNYANKKIKPILNISCDEAVLTKRKLR